MKFESKCIIMEATLNEKADEHVDLIIRAKYNDNEDNKLSNIRLGGAKIILEYEE